MDVDVGGTPEPETVAMETALDGEGDAIVQQLERSLPRWEGFEDVGWSHNIPQVCFLLSMSTTKTYCNFLQERFLPIVQAISGYQGSR